LISGVADQADEGAKEDEADGVFCSKFRISSAQSATPEIK
jgi:hypothetical protein